jgi:hypothetical protein
MKKIFFFLLCFVAFSASAQDSTLKEYVGKYIFPEGSVVPAAEVSLSGNQLTVNSTHGSSVMEKRGRDTFALVSFDGMAYYTRNKAGQVSGVKVEVGEYILEGVKEGVTALLNRKQYFLATRRQLVK